MTGGKRRHQLFADRNLQGALLVHTAIYWFYCLFSVTLIAVCWIIFTKQPESSVELFTQLWLNCGPALLGSVLLLPLVMLDCLRLSSKFAGPMVRMQRVMRELAAGETPPPFRLRPGDYWDEFADNMNLVMNRLREQESRSHASCPSEPQTKSAALDTEQEIAETNTNSAMQSAAPFVAPTAGEATVASIYSDLSI